MLRGSTMRLWSVPPLLLALLWILASVAMLHAADDPGDTYMQVYQAYQDGSKLELDGKLDEALQKFRFCVSVLEQVQQKYPDYQPLVVDFRLKKSRAAIARVQSMQLPASAGATADALPPEPAATSPKAVPRFHFFSDDYRLPVSPAAPAPAPFPPPGAYGGGFSGGSVGSLRMQIRDLQERLNQVTQTNEELNNKLLQTTVQLQSAQREIDLWRVRSVEQTAQLTQSRQSNEDLQLATSRLSQQGESDQRRIATLEADLKAAQADVEVANEYSDGLFTKLEKASQFIEADEKIRTELLDERKQLSAQLNEKTSAVLKAEKERDAAVEKKDVLQKQAVEFEKLEDQNKSLAAKLAAAEKQAAGLSVSKDERGKIESDLRDQMDSANKSLTVTRDELKAGRQRIVELEKQLSDTASASAGAASAMADENALLKSLVTRQLQDQAKRQQARKLVEEEMEKLQIRSGDLLGKLNAMAGGETKLTPQEKKLFDPSLTAGSGVADFSFEVVKETPKSAESDLPPELITRASEANELAQKRRFAEARDIYAEIAKKAPDSYLAAVNLGIAQRQLEDYPHAIAAFQRALELKSGDPFALTNLGTAEYRNGDINEAVSTLQKAVAADSDSYVAHYLLGMALNDQGDRAGALRELQLSLGLKPDYLPAVQLERELRTSSSSAAPPVSQSPQAPQVAQ